MNNATSRAVAVRVAWSLYGLPYRWGGDDPMTGFDCSGFIIEILKAAGKLPHLGDWTARNLFELFKSRQVEMPKRGCLAFWGKDPDQISHVEFCLNDVISIGASGGGSQVLNLEDAIRKDAYIKARKIRGRGQIIAFVDPFLNHAAAPG